MALPMLSVDQVLTGVDGAPAAADLDPYLLTMVFANAAARAGRKAIPDAAGAADAFARQWLQRLGQVGWIITAAGTTRLTSSGTGQTATVADRLRQAAGSDGGVPAVLDAVAAGAADPGPVLQLWWRAVTDPALMQGAIGRLGQGPDGLQLALVGFTLDGSKLRRPAQGLLHRTGVPVDLSSPAALFEEVQAGSIDLTTTSLTAVLKGDVFAAQRPDLDRMVGAKMAEHVAAEPPSLMTPGQP